MRIDLYLLLVGAVSTAASALQEAETCKDEGFCKIAGVSCEKLTGNETCTGSNIPDACTGKDCVCCSNDNNCPNGFDRVGSECFKVYHQEFAEWDEARQICRDFGWELAEPENLFTLVDIIDSKFSGKHIWIGGRGIGGSFKYLSGQALQGNQPWYTDYPVKMDLEHCLILKRSQLSNKTTLASYDCFGRYNFICEPTCPEGFVRVGSLCFKLVTTSMSWDDSEINCNEEGLRLAEPEDPKGLAKMIYDGKFGSRYSGNDFWIGARGGRIDGATIAWNNGDPVPVPYPITSTWRSGYPRSKTSSYCLRISIYYHSSAPMWEYRCSHSYYSICEWKCPLGFFHFDNQCYKMLFSSTSWTKAREMCIQAGSMLAEPENPTAMGDYLYSVTGRRNYWIGGRGDGNRLRWSLGEVVPSSWLKGQSWNSGKKVGMNYCLKLSPDQRFTPLTSTTCSTRLYPLCLKRIN